MVYRTKKWWIFPWQAVKSDGLYVNSLMATLEKKLVLWRFDPKYVVIPLMMTVFF